jgi:hypothetical protein
MIGGVTPKSVDLKLQIEKVSDAKTRLEVNRPKAIPSDWLPDSPRGPFSYTLEVSATVEIAPAVLMNFDPKIPGLSGPIPLVLRVESNWENLGKDPLTKNYFLNQ